MTDSFKSKPLDMVDRQILKVLQNEAQLSNAEIARKVNLSPPATHARIKRLENEGYINQYAAILNKQKLGYDLLLYIFVSTQVHQSEQLDALEQAIKDMPEILEFHCLTGEYDYLLKVVTKDRNELELLIRKLNLLSGVTRIQTNLSLREVKVSTALPILE